MPAGMPSAVGGYVLAGGESSRMGQDKALLELAGKPLLVHALLKLRRVCADVCVLSGRPELERYAPLVPDVHPGCGPMGGLEAALLHSQHDWNFFLPVDMPFVPTAFLGEWMKVILRDAAMGFRTGILTDCDAPQPALCMLHKEVLPFLSEAIEGKQFKLLPVLEEAGRQLAVRHGAVGPEDVQNLASAGRLRQRSEAWRLLSESQEGTRHLWFANLNTPEDFSEAVRNGAALDT